MTPFDKLLSRFHFQLEAHGIESTNALEAAFRNALTSLYSAPEPLDEDGHTATEILDALEMSRDVSADQLRVLREAVGLATARRWSADAADLVAARLLGRG